MTRFLCRLSLALLVLPLAVSRPLRADQPTSTPAVPPLIAAFRSRAPALLKYLQNVKKYETVGVLKFEVRRGDGSGLHDAGELNIVLAHQAEVALCQSRSVKKGDTMMVIANASQFVQKGIPRANHRTEEGRKAFFFPEYPSEFGNGTRPVDAFVVGIATLSADLQRIKVEFQVFDRTGQLVPIPPKDVPVIDVETDPDLLGNARKSYAISPTLVAGPPDAVRKDVLDSARRNEAMESMPNNCEPLQALKDCPVKWEIFQGDAPLQVIGNRVQEPVRGKALGFRLTNRSGGAYAVVLMVNGKNTLYEERYSALVCRKWVLEKDATLIVNGFQTEQNKQQLFEILEGAEARQQFNEDEINYKDGTAGTFRLVVFAGQNRPKSDRPASTVVRNGDALVMRGVRGNPRSTVASQPQNLEDALSQLRKGDRFSDHGRGYVAKGAKVEENPTTDVSFELTSETPVADITLRYYAPER